MHEYIDLYVHAYHNISDQLDVIFKLRILDLIRF